MDDVDLEYEGTLNLTDGYRVVSVSLEGTPRCFAIGPNGHPLARTGFPSIDQARSRIEEIRAQGTATDVSAVAPSALPPDQRLKLEPLVDTILRVEIAGVYVALLGILLGGDAVMWILELPTQTGTRSYKVFKEEETAIEAYEELCASLSTRFISQKLGDFGGE